MATGMIDFLNAAPTTYHAVQECITRLEKKGFGALRETEKWDGQLQPGGRYYFTRNRSTIIAFTVGAKYVPGNRFKIVGCHTDSPTLKLKPVTKIEKHGYAQVGVECYGGGLWNTWFDRDLTIAGRVIVEREGKYCSELVWLRNGPAAKPILRIPSLCIHLQTPEERKAFGPNKEDHLAPTLALCVKRELGGEGSEAPPADKKAKHVPELMQLLAEELKCAPGDIKDYELMLCDMQPSTQGGASDEFVFSGRLDNLASTYCALEALLTYTDGIEDDSEVAMVAFFDHEECGSDSAYGAGGPVMKDAIERVVEALAADQCHPVNLHQVTIAKSFLISADMAHAIHPNYAGKHESNHQPKMGDGTVIKINQNQRYSTNMYTGFFIREIARKHDIPFQEFVVRNDCPCGSTIGPIISSLIGIRTIDVGAPMLSMHSIREQCGSDDMDHFYNLCVAFFHDFGEVDDKVDSEVISSL